MATDPKPQPERVYLGDGLYASFDGYNIVVETERLNGMHYIAFEPGVAAAFIRLVRKHYPGLEK